MPSFKAPKFFAIVVLICSSVAAMDRKSNREKSAALKRYHSAESDAPEQTTKKRKINPNPTMAATPQNSSSAASAAASTSQTAFVAQGPKKSKWLREPAQIIDLKNQIKLSQEISDPVNENNLERCIKSNSPSSSLAWQLECAQTLLENNANPNAYYHAPLLLQLIKRSPSDTLIKDKENMEGELTSLIVRGELASLLLKHNADTAIPQEGANAIPAIVYPQHTVYTYAVGQPAVLNAFKRRHKEIGDAVNTYTPLIAALASIIAQYIIPIEIGFTDTLHYANPGIILSTPKTQDELEKGLLTALALRSFTENKEIKRNLTSIALALLDRINTKSNTAYSYINDQGKQVGPALHIAVLSDKEDGALYVDPQATQETASFSAMSTATASPIKKIIAYGADEQATDSSGKTARQHALEQYLKTPVLRRQAANARSTRFGWMH